jgi:hypothetical protein
VLGLVVLIALLAGAAISATRLVRPRNRGDRHEFYLTDREAAAGHLVMNLAMAGMLSPWCGPRIHLGIVGLLAGLVAALAVLLIKNLVRTTEGGPNRGAALGYHLLAAATMLYATAAMPTTAMADMDSTVPNAMKILAVVFAIDAVATAVVAVAAPDMAVMATARSASTETSSPGAAAIIDRERSDLRVASLPHLAMDVAMVLMLLKLL